MRILKRLLSKRTTLIGGTVLLLLFSGLIESSEAQRETPRPRITRSINDNSVVRLRNTTHSRIRTAIDKGPVPADLPMERVILMLKSSPEQEAELEELLVQQQDPSSPHYHQWLTPQQFGQRFGTSLQDVNQITEWLETHGFRVDDVATGHRDIQFSGTANQVNETFHTEIHEYESDGEVHIANAMDISIPEALTPVIGGNCVYARLPFAIHDFST